MEYYELSRYDKDEQYEPTVHDTPAPLMAHVSTVAKALRDPVSSSYS